MKIRSTSTSFHRRVVERAAGALLAAAIAAAVLGALVLSLAACDGDDAGEHRVASAFSDAARARA